MGQIASEALIERLADWGVDTVFGMLGAAGGLRDRYPERYVPSPAPAGLVAPVQDAP
jgi:hypothetical protein